MQLKSTATDFTSDGYIYAKGKEYMPLYQLRCSHSLSNTICLLDKYFVLAGYDKKSNKRGKGSCDMIKKIPIKLLHMRNPSNAYYIVSPPLRRLTMVSSTFQFLNFDGSVLQIFISCCYNNDIKQISDHC